ATLVPMLATRLISGEAHSDSVDGSGPQATASQRIFHRWGVWFDRLDQSYRSGLQWALGRRLWVIGGAIGITLLAIPLMLQVGSEMMPVADSGDFSVSVKMPVGTSLEKTDKVMQQVEKIVLANPEVATAFAAAGTQLRSSGTTGSLVPFQGSVNVKLKPDAKSGSLDVIRSLRRKIGNIPGARVRLEQTDLVSMIMTGGGQGLEVDIFGDDLGTLSQLAKDLMGRVRGIPGLENLDVNWQEAMPEIQWAVDRDKANQLGLSFQDIANTINTATNGSIASYYQEAGFQYPIIVQVPERSRKTVDEMLHLVVSSSSGTNDRRGITLSQVAHPVYATGPSQITRQDRQRYIAVTGTPQGRSMGDVQKDMEKAVSGTKFPAGYYWSWGTNQQRTKDEFSGLGVAVFLAIALIYMLLASQFEALLHPLTILATVPLAGCGVALALFLSGRPFGLTAFIGALMLVGIVVKNGILLVDYTNQLRERGLDCDQALLQAGPTRLRPILMTASAAILGMLPIAIGIGKGSEVQAPMATAVIGGLMTSTILTLFVVPVVYSLLNGLVVRVTRAKSAAPPAQDLPTP
ncbi:MAG: efflux RND transporter permease subunit, partial [Armatimonadota bacterium]